VTVRRPPVGPVVERVGRTEKARIVAEFDASPVALDQFTQSVVRPVCRSTGREEAVARTGVEVFLESLLERFRPIVIDGIAVRSEFVPEVSHCAENECQFVRMIRSPFGERPRFDHQHAPLAGTLDRADTSETITENEHSHGKFPGFGISGGSI
jgi:hypothetical protein